MLLYLSGSFPRFHDGIADGAVKLLDEMLVHYDQIKLLVSDLPQIREYTEHNIKITYFYMPSWRIKKDNIKYFLEICQDNDIDCIHMEYPGDGYGKTLLASLLPLIIKLYNIKKHKSIQFYIRLHEFTKARLLRKVAIMPMVLFADKVYIPALYDRTVLKKYFGEKIQATFIGSNIEYTNNIDTNIQSHNKINIAYFGFVYHGKGIERLFKLWKEIKERDLRHEICFTIIGELNPNNDNHFADYHKKAYHWLEAFDLLNDVRITGYEVDAHAVSHELNNVDIAMLLYEDGLTLRRGSFIACLEHGIPIITTPGDQEANELFGDCQGVAMTQTDSEVIEKVFEWVHNSDKREIAGKQNKQRSQIFDWSVIAQKLLNDYGLI